MIETKPDDTKLLTYPTQETTNPLDELLQIPHKLLIHEAPKQDQSKEIEELKQQVQILISTVSNLQYEMERRSTYLRDRLERNARTLQSRTSCPVCGGYDPMCSHRDDGMRMYY